MNIKIGDLGLSKNVKGELHFEDDGNNLVLSFNATNETLGFLAFKDEFDSIYFKCDRIYFRKPGEFIIDNGTRPEMSLQFRCIDPSENPGGTFLAFFNVPVRLSEQGENQSVFFDSLKVLLDNDIDREDLPYNLTIQKWGNLLDGLVVFDDLYSLLAGLDIKSSSDFMNKNREFMKRLMRLNKQERDITLNAIGVDTTGHSNVVRNEYVRDYNHVQGNNYYEEYVKPLKRNQEIGDETRAIIQTDIQRALEETKVRDAIENERIQSQVGDETRAIITDAVKAKLNDEEIEKQILENIEPVKKKKDGFDEETNILTKEEVEDYKKQIKLKAKEEKQKAKEEKLRIKLEKKGITLEQYNIKKYNNLKIRVTAILITSIMLIIDGIFYTLDYFNVFKYFTEIRLFDVGVLNISLSCLVVIALVYPFSYLVLKILYKEKNK